MPWGWPRSFRFAPHFYQYGRWSEHVFVSTAVPGSHCDHTHFYLILGHKLMLSCLKNESSLLMHNDLNEVLGQVKIKWCIKTLGRLKFHCAKQVQCCIFWWFPVVAVQISVLQKQIYLLFIIFIVEIRMRAAVWTTARRYKGNEKGWRE